MLKSLPSKPMKAGTYKVKGYVPANGSNYAEVYSTSFTTFSIEKAKLTKPKISGDYTYTGNLQTVSLINYNRDTMEIVGNTQTSAILNKAVTISLSDTVNYEWEDGTEEDVILNWTIAKKTIVVMAEKKNSFYNQDLVPLTYTFTPELFQGDTFIGELATNANKE